MKNINENENLDIKNLNNLLRRGNNILKIFFIFIVIIGLYAITLVFKEWKIISFFLTILKVLAPFFIGLIIAWLLNPCVNFMTKKGLNRILSTVLTYALLLLILYLVITSLFPVLLNQVNDFVTTIPKIVNDIKNWAEGFIDRFKGSELINVVNIKNDISASAHDLIKSLTTDTPAMIISCVRGIISTIGILALGLMVGFYLLFDFNNVGKVLLSLFPKRMRKDAKELSTEINNKLLGYVKGTLLVSTLIFILSSIIFISIGLKAPLLFSLICGITNIIPYIGPYIGGIPAVVVGLSQGLPTGILALIGIFVVQFVEGNFIQPIVMSKTMKLHPVTIILSLLIFGYFFGIGGMIIATPLMATIKSIAVFFEKKYNIFKFDN